MTSDEMRAKAGRHESGVTSADVIAAAIWGVGAEVVERLEYLIVAINPSATYSGDMDE